MPRRGVALITAFAFLLAPLGAAAQSPSPAPSAAPAPGDPPPSMDMAYQHALDQYEHGDYAEAAKSLKEVIENAPPGFDRDKLLRAWLYRGNSLFLTNDRDGAEKAFWQVLLLDPEFRPDPLFTLPSIISCFDGVRTAHAEQLKSVPRIAKHRPDTARDPIGVPLTPIPGEAGFFDAIAPVLPFGYAQYKNHHTAKAWLLGASEGALVVVITGTYISFQTLRKPGSHFHTDEVGAARLDKTINNAAYAALLAEIVYGAIDGVYYNARNRAHSPATGPRIAPGPGTAGLSFEYRF